jgi:Ras GTPase-activating-like protein IQGAP2/3
LGFSENREERLLLTIFRMIIAESFENAESMGSLLRANTAITQMLSAYAKRGLGLGILKEILAQPLQDITRQTSLNLEINPSVVYKQLITNYETTTGKTWELSRNFTPEECAQFREVRRLIKPHILSEPDSVVMSHSKQLAIVCFPATKVYE